MRRRKSENKRRNTRLLYKGQAKCVVLYLLCYARSLAKNRDLERESLLASTQLRVHRIRSLCFINFVLVSHGEANENIILPADTSGHPSPSLTYLLRVREN